MRTINLNRCGFRICAHSLLPVLLSMAGIAGNGQTTIHRINSGGQGFTDTSGNVWSADSLFTGGSSYVVTSPIQNTLSPTAYRAERWWTATSGIISAYRLPVPAAGDYEIRLHFAETYPTTKTVGACVFDVLIDNVVVLKSLDIFAEAGADTALVKTFSVRTTGQSIAIGVAAVRQNPKINAIEVLQASTAEQPGSKLPGVVSGDLKVWHNISLTFDGPSTSEASTPNPFLDYRMDVTFSNGAKTLVVPGYYAADGDAAETSAAAGNKWRVHFVPDEEGTWTYRVSFRAGTNVSVSDSTMAGSPAGPDGSSGTIAVSATDKLSPDHRSKGFLRYAGERYFRFAGTGEYFLKGGADSPENFLAFAEFDSTPAKHYYSPHAADWRSGDPSWKNGKGKNIIGALNYLASKEMNSVYFLTMNVGGDGNDVWPWTASSDRTRFDVSKLAQWEIVFTHMDRRGIMLHVVTQETENDQLLDGGALGTQRKLYYRELIARFAHHLAVVWNLGEENTNTDAQRKAYAAYIRKTDPYNHPITVHNVPDTYSTTYTPLLGFPALEGPSLQIANPSDVYSVTSDWVAKSKAAGRPWVVTVDEIGPASVGVAPDSSDPYHDLVRQSVLWGNLMAGGAGVEWYFGYAYPNHDLNAEDWRSRDRMWDMTRDALRFFRQLPLPALQDCNAAVSGSGVRCTGKPGEVYVIELPNGGTTSLNVTQHSGTFLVKWFNPREGGALQNGTITSISGSAIQSIGLPPTQQSSHWVALVSNTSTSSTPSVISIQRLALMNADSGAPVPGFETMASGVVLTLSQLPRRLNIRAYTSPESVGSVRFGINEITTFRLESVAPYALAGDTGGVYNHWPVSPGTYILSATPYSSASGTGTAGTPLTLQIIVK